MVGNVVPAIGPHTAVALTVGCSHGYCIGVVMRAGSVSVALGSVSSIRMDVGTGSGDSSRSAGVSPRMPYTSLAGCELWSADLSCSVAV